MRISRHHFAFRLGGCHPCLLMHKPELVAAVVAIRYAQEAASSQLSSRTGQLGAPGRLQTVSK